MDDPDHDKNLRSHTGYHPKTMLDMARKLSDHEVKLLSEQLDGWYQDQIGNSPLENEATGKNLLIVTVCKKERHRSVAA